ncbi:MAG TPA: MBL fold metallo-hydrolase [Solirubrobacterales bacterium]|jgi:glyoxylase-like metal-dependent hydrolase (beta-lactamase superfamily II)|nr:MBL fold metallo-hydrolase [Solirubrobacterales bacterium]
MKRLAPGVWRVKEFPGPTINVYLAENVLIDAGRKWDRKRIFAELEGVEIAELALTHVHPDHQGCAKWVCDAREVPLACHADDVDAMEGRASVGSGAALIPRIYDHIWTGPPHKVDRVLAAGDEVAGFRVVHAPGHAPGEVIFFRDSDRVAICGDVVRNMSYLTALPGVRQPPDEMTYDPAENRRSIRKLAALEPSLILPGHGPAITDMAKFDAFVAALPVD